MWQCPAVWVKATVSRETQVKSDRCVLNREVGLTVERERRVTDAV